MPELRFAAHEPIGTATDILADLRERVSLGDALGHDEHAAQCERKQREALLQPELDALVCQIARNCAPHFARIGWFSLLLGRDMDAINYLERSLAIKPDEDGSTHWQFRWLAAAHARTGNVTQARQYLASAERLLPYDTVRSRAPELLTSSVYVEQFRGFQDALRLASLRDHADEYADFGVPADAALHELGTGRPDANRRAGCQDARHGGLRSVPLPNPGRSSSTR